MNLQKGLLDYEDYFERGKIHFYNKNFKEAKLDFSEFIIRSERIRKAAICKNITSHFKEKAHFLRAICNFYLSDFNDQNGFEYDKEYLEGSTEKLYPFYATFLFVLWLTNHGNERQEFETAIKMISDFLIFNPNDLDSFGDYLIHLPLDFQVIFKMHFY